MRFLLRVVVSAAALGVATAAVPGIELLAGSGWSKVGTLMHLFIGDNRPEDNEPPPVRVVRFASP